MRKLTVVIIVAFALWGGYWFVASRAVQNGLSTWLSEQLGTGWVAEYSSLRTRGFPNRFDTTISDLRLESQRAGVTWQVPRFQIFALSYKPNNIIAVWPDQFSLALPGEDITITSAQIIGSVAFTPGTALELDRSSFEIDDAAIVSSRGWSMNMATARLATRQTEGTPFAHDISINASGIQPPRALLARLDPGGALPAVFEALTIDATVSFDAQWDRISYARQRPQITGLEWKKFQAIWGDLDLSASGELAIDARGVPSGLITLRTSDWREMLAIGIANGAVSSGVSQTFERALELLAALSDDPDVLEIPLRFKDGFMSFGPIPLGPAPRLARR
jgi:hypothetical protein